MLFIIKKWIGGLLMPLPFALCILFISLILLFFTQKQKLAKTMALFSFLILLIFSVLPTAYYLSKPLERKYPPLLVAEQSLDYILVLGSVGCTRSNLTNHRAIVSHSINIDSVKRYAFIMLTLMQLLWCQVQGLETVKAMQNY